MSSIERSTVNADSMSSDVSQAEVPLIASDPYSLRVSLSATITETDLRAALETGDLGFVHSFTTGSAVDGPGVRLVAWLSGCQFKCVYCHNPDTWKMTNGIPVPLSRAIEQIKKYRHELRALKGGVTISGGEPLMQHRFVQKVLAAAKELGVHTALDSNGYLGDRLSDADLAAVDLVLLDLKAFTSELHRQLTGMDNQPVLKFAHRLAAAHKPVWVRFVLVPGWTDDLTEIGRIARFAAALGNVQRVDVLPFHQMGRFKWQKLGTEYQLHETLPPSQETMDAAITAFRSTGLNTF